MNFLYFCARCKYIVLEYIPSSSCLKYEVCRRKFMAKFMQKFKAKFMQKKFPFFCLFKKYR